MTKMHKRTILGRNTKPGQLHSDILCSTIHIIKPFPEAIAGNLFSCF
jgi:hypothetical protein